MKPARRWPGSSSDDVGRDVALSGDQRSAPESWSSSTGASAINAGTAVQLSSNTRSGLRSTRRQQRSSRGPAHDGTIPKLDAGQTAPSECRPLQFNSFGDLSTGTCATPTSARLRIRRRTARAVALLHRRLGTGNQPHRRGRLLWGRRHVLSRWAHRWHAKALANRRMIWWQQGCLEYQLRLSC